MHWRLIFQVLATFFSGSIIGYSDLYHFKAVLAIALDRELVKENRKFI
jgi:hypothetical protein